MEGGDLRHRRSGFFFVVVPHVIVVVKCSPHLDKIYGKRGAERTFPYIVVLMVHTTYGLITCCR